MNTCQVFKEITSKLQEEYAKYQVGRSLQDVFTSPKLTFEMLKHVDTLNNKSVLVIANLETYLLLKGLKQDGMPNSKWKSLHFLTDNKSLRGKDNVIYCDFNKLDKLNIDMKFDVVIGNPPYQDSSNNAKNVKLWTKFIYKSLSLDPSLICFITPNNLIKNNKFGIKYRSNINKLGYGFVYAKNHQVKVFKGASIDTCHWILAKGAKKDFNPIGIEKDNPIESSIINKVIFYPNKLNLKMYNGHVAKSMLTDSGNDIYFSGNKVKHTKQSLEGNKILKFVFPFSCSYKSMFITNKPTGMLNLAIKINNMHEGDVIRSYANSKLFNFVASKYNKTSGFTPFVKENKVPDLIRDTIWTDKELYKYFNLSEEEIKFVENLNI